MNIVTKNYSISVKGTRNYQSISISEGFEVAIDETFDEFQFEAEKQKLKDKLVEESKNYLNVFVEEITFDGSISIK